MDTKSLKLDIVKRLLTVDDEALLGKINALIEAHQHPETLSQEQINLLEERFEAYKANPDSGLTWAEVKERIKK